MAIPVIERFIYSPQESLVLITAVLINGVALYTAGFMETRGTHMQYSKFWNQMKSSSDSQTPAKVSSRIGMLIFYTPAFLGGVIGLVLFPDESLRFVLLASCLTIHFLKRDLEVLFIHKYSGSIAVDHSIVISFLYFITTAGIIYAQYLSRELPEPSVDLKYAGVALFLIGITGNFYHHYILSQLRKAGEKAYKIPRGGLFSLVICPHYLFEILGFLGICFISQTIYAFFFTLGMTVYLVGRSYATRKWYLEKFEDFPKDVRALIPYVY